VFDFYWKILSQELSCQSYKTVACIGNTTENWLTSRIHADKEFYDLQLKNCDINDNAWSPKNVYDLIICTRCAYFAKDPDGFVKRCLSWLNTGGILFIDWGLGDHWRFPKFKVGWVRDNEHEYAEYCGKKHFLYSCMWSHELEQNVATIDFKRNIERFGYDPDRMMSEILLAEVPSVYAGADVKRTELLTLWPDTPQLYIANIFRR
jgi:SAM-dependent methyltransferase